MDYEKQTTEQVKIGRLLRKIENLKKQRDHFKERLSHYMQVIDDQPNVYSRFQDSIKYYEKRKEERLMNEYNLQSVREQEELIKRLLNYGCSAAEIRNINDLTK